MMAKPLFFAYLLGVNAGLTQFVHWTMKEAQSCGIPSYPVTIVPNLMHCYTSSSAVFALHTHFEQIPHSFGITACDDDRIFIGLRINSGIMEYLEFLKFEEFKDFMTE